MKFPLKMEPWLLLKLKCNTKIPLAYNVLQHTFAGGLLMGRRTGSKGIIFAALGLGLLISLILPAKFIIIFLAVALVFSGISLCKN